MWFERCDIYEDSLILARARDTMAKLNASVLFVGKGIKFDMNLLLLLQRQITPWKKIVLKVIQYYLNVKLSARLYILPTIHVQCSILLLLVHQNSWGLYLKGRHMVERKEQF